MGFNTFLITIISCVQNATIFAVLNGEHFVSILNISARHSFLNPSSFHMGAMFGASLGVSVINLIISIYFGQMSRCQNSDTDIPQYKCEYKGAMRSIWFFAGLLFWLNAALAVLIAIGKDELALGRSHYEDISISNDEFESDATRQHIAGDGRQQGSQATYEMV
eukprot:CAMPEP_0113580702 /NCGR_PEP_ID=MMETSP0015_2-20120614/30840_1 /TAXON_ID=2838 /ORGANISM="Odontella" /LENGTH=163 /DNA_ID=CAMNT_0000484961 /DNA_START=94 /DNA_END=585 /DNA_ORIENTATION=+ /assembly_acc=CAM_ASM_000160